MVIREITEELLDDSSLLVGQIADIVQFVQVTEIGKNPVSICHVLVDIVKVGEEQLPPAVEVVKGLVNIGTADIRQMEVTYQFDRVRDDATGV